MSVSTQEKEEIKQQVLHAINDLPDPEIPVLTIEDLGIVKKIHVNETGAVTVGITPTYSGCPAIVAIELAVQHALLQAGLTAKVERLLSPAWSSDDISTQGLQKMHDYGIAPPVKDDAPIACVLCGSVAVTKISEFGTTACKALYKCQDCLEPFDYFKCL